MHFHSPSEHTIDGMSSTLEVHFVYADSYTHQPGAVLAVLFYVTDDIGGFGDTGHNELLNDISPDFVDDDDRHTENIMMGTFFSQLNLTAFYYYDGSFTTPPCTEGIKWFVSTNILTIS